MFVVYHIVHRHGGKIPANYLEMDMALDLPNFKMTREEADKVMEENPPTCVEVRDFHINMTWSWKACGFGELWIRQNEDGKYSYDTECMGPQSVRKFLHALADKIADDLVKQGAFP
jgi:hypothetical protein